MSRQDRAEQILEIKQRNLRAHGLQSYALQLLQHEWSKAQEKPSTPDFYVIRSVTIIEVLVRRNLTALIDHSDQYTDRAVELSKHFKMDFGLVRHIQGRAITLGDIIAHSVPVNSFGQIIGYFETLLGKPVRPILSQAVDRFAVERKKEPSEPIIRDFDRLAERLNQLFEVRHILCHELPAKPVYAITEIDDFLEQAIRFTQALQEVLTFEMFGLVPLTQTEMNIEAHESLRKTEAEMLAVLSELRSRVKKSDDESHPALKFDDTWLSCLDGAQEKWLAYRNAECEFETYLSRGGTIRSMLWGNKAERLTKARIEELESFSKMLSDLTIL